MIVRITFASVFSCDIGRLIAQDDMFGYIASGFQGFLSSRFGGLSDTRMKHSQTMIRKASVSGVSDGYASGLFLMLSAEESLAAIITQSDVPQGP